MPKAKLLSDKMVTRMVIIDFDEMIGEMKAQDDMEDVSEREILDTVREYQKHIIYTIRDKYSIPQERVEEIVEVGIDIIYDAIEERDDCIRVMDNHFKKYKVKKKDFVRLYNANLKMALATIKMMILDKADDDVEE